MVNANRITRILKDGGIDSGFTLGPLLTIKFMQLRFSRTKNNCCGNFTLYNGL
jgi:hypothetical protein